MTSARLWGAFSIPVSELTFSASVTSRGATSTRQVPMKANVYRVMNRQPTRSIVCCSWVTAPPSLERSRDPRSNLEFVP